MNRRNFLNVIMCSIVGLFGLKSNLLKRKLQPGQIWKDKDHIWTGYGSPDFTFLLLSRDRAEEQDDPNCYWKVAEFMHASNGSGLFGACIRYFLDEEVERMYYEGMMV